MTHRFLYFDFRTILGVGVASAFLVLVLLPMYCSLNSWTLFYFIKSFHKIPPWTKCNQKWSSDHCIESPAFANFSSSSQIDSLKIPQATDSTLTSTILSTLLNSTETTTFFEDIVKKSISSSELSESYFSSNVTTPISDQLSSTASPYIIYASSEFFE